MKFNPYIYEPDKSIEVYKETEKYFEENPEVKSRIEELGWIYHTVGMIIPQNSDNFWSGHFSPFIYSWEELQISFTQICMGLYKQAFVSLRSGLELGMLSVYFNINNDGHTAVKDWLNSKDNREADTPRANTIWKILLSKENIKKFNEKHDIRKIFDELGKLMNEAAGVADGMRREVETMVKSQMERLVADLDLVKREDFDVLRELVQIQGEEIQALRKDLDNFKKKKKA